MTSHWRDVDEGYDTAATRLVDAHAKDGHARDLPIPDLRTWGVLAQNARFALAPLARHHDPLPLRSTGLSGLLSRLGAPVEFVRDRLPAPLQLATVNYLMADQRVAPGVLRLRGPETLAHPRYIVERWRGAAMVRQVAEVIDQLHELTQQERAGVGGELERGRTNARGVVGSREGTHTARPRGFKQEVGEATCPGENGWMTESSFLPYSDAELVLGLVSPVGTNLDRFIVTLEAILREFEYSTNTVRLSGLATELVDVSAPTAGSDEFRRLTRLMDAGNEARRRGGAADVLALAAAGAISRRRSGEPREPLKRTAHVLRSLKHPGEVLTLRRIYGPAFFLIGVVSSEDDRKRYLNTAKSCSPLEIETVLDRDLSEGSEFGQRTRDTFHLADVFIPSEDRSRLERFINLVFGVPLETPTQDEYSMFLAFAAALRSGDLSRQVGAVIVSQHGDVVSVGANDVPRPTGGLFWPGKGDRRDHVLGFDSNEVERGRIIDDILTRLRPDGYDEDEWKRRGIERLLSATIMDITEYGRPVHAEMEAILAAGRSGVGARGATLYSTTFPCHNCAKHIIGAGIARVVYVEPYPKSRTASFYGDSIHLGPVSACDERVAFEAFEGVGPRRFVDLLSMGSYNGYPVKRKVKGGRVRDNWNPTCAEVRFPLLPNSYMQREQHAAEELVGRFPTKDGNDEQEA